MRLKMRWALLLVLAVVSLTPIKAQDMEKVDVTEIYNELKECGVFYLATVDGDQPRVRPFGALAVYEGRLYLQTGKVKNVYRQLAANGKFELCAMKTMGSWIRVSGRLVLDDRLEAKQWMLDQNPTLERMYSADDDNTAVLYIEDGVATFSSFVDEPRTVSF